MQVRILYSCVHVEYKENIGFIYTQVEGEKGQLAAIFLPEFGLSNEHALSKHLHSSDPKIS